MPAGAAAAAACCCYCHGLKIPLSQSTEGSVSMRRRVSHRNARQNSALKKHHPERSPMARRAVSVFVGTAARRHFIFPIIHRLNLSCLSLGIPRTTSSRLGSMCSGVPISSFFFFLPFLQRRARLSSAGGGWPLPSCRTWLPHAEG